MVDKSLEFIGGPHLEKLAFIYDEFVRWKELLSSEFKDSLNKIRRNPALILVVSEK